MNDKVYTIYNADGVVLIDTWWNVNSQNSTKRSHMKIVLIDTWWNVNVIFTVTFPFDPTVLIDTWWNVNSAMLNARRTFWKF